MNKTNTMFHAISERAKKPVSQGPHMNDTRTLINGLNQDLEREYQALIMYNTYAATLVGPHRKEIAEFFRSEIADEQGHAQMLADKICALGGQPATRPAQVPHAVGLRGMLEAAQQAEAETVEHYKQRREHAVEVGDLGLVSDLETIISQETRHKEECEEMLRAV